ncbi:hypothetical protein [Dictyobacter aurantiacus]|uniref:Serine active site containing 1-like protein n=1 Tax=Dictyobacter aurantiacus TaxID=1936993 RepID=A0A401ZFW5_9CHLR|nr:hypothetical protein [Dictyobacter aurantiacus]GCE05693.1 hypothetical protein KDAU_30220 [Dictyobacter aurantiacus]
MSTLNETAAATGKPAASRRDLLALYLGIAFSVLFTAVIWFTGDWLKGFPHLPKPAGDASWYYWKLADPTLITHLTAWLFYALHQVVLWGLIWYAQTHVKKYTTGLHRINLITLGANVFFILLHFVQTQLWYDGLAQDVSIFSSQGSVIVLLIWVLLMDNNRRGIFFGQRLPISRRVLYAARKFHPYFFSWAAVYTFWYHPMENTPGHLIGFFYMFMILLQGSLFFTRVHVNRYWMFTQEILVLAHGTLVAIQNGNSLWPMFFFGFGAIFVVTQMYGLGLKAWMRWSIIAAYVLAVLGVYSVRGFGHIWEVVAIPLIDYPSVIVLALLFALGVQIYAWLRPASKLPPQSQQITTVK